MVCIGFPIFLSKSFHEEGRVIRQVFFGILAFVNFRSPFFCTSTMDCAFYSYTARSFSLKKLVF